MTALAKEGHETPTPIQSQAIPALLEGHDLLGVAQTGTGKTAAFSLPLIDKLHRGERAKGGPRALILTPTRELAGQVHERIEAYGAGSGLRAGLVIGGASIGKQKSMLRRGVDILVATPGRLEDLMKQRAVQLDSISILVLDEVDQMLDMGFIHAIRAITATLPKDRQSLFFSATMPREIARLAQALLTDPVRIDIEPEQRPRIEQSVRFVSKPEKIGVLIEIVKEDAFKSGLVFSRTKHGADKIVRQLQAAGASAQAIHGNRSQGQRERALKAFKRGETPILVATDIAARGIDVDGVTHVINYDLPNVPETYVHRIGRTARAGKSGIAISFCSPEERVDLRAIERLTGEKLSAVRADSGAQSQPKAERHAQSNAERPAQPRGERPDNAQRKPKPKRAHRNGLRDGRQDGQREDRKEGQREGRKEGQRDTRSEGRKDGQREGQHEARQEGRSEGSQEGRSQNPHRTAARKDGSRDSPKNNRRPPQKSAGKPRSDRRAPTAKSTAPAEKSNAEREADALIAGMAFMKPANEENPNRKENHGEGRAARVRRRRRRSAA